MDSLQAGLAPAVGLVGVLIGAWLTTRSQSSAWLRDQQLVTYRDYIVAANDGIDFFATSVRAAVRRGTDAPTVSGRFGEKVAALLVLYHVVQLIGSPKVVNSAAEIKDAVDEALMLVAETSTGRISYESTQWNALTGRLRSAQSAFPIVARQDLRKRLRREGFAVESWTIDELRARLPEARGKL